MTNRKSRKLHAGADERGNNWPNLDNQTKDPTPYLIPKNTFCLSEIIIRRYAAPLILPCNGWAI